MNPKERQLERQLAQAQKQIGLAKQKLEERELERSSGDNITSWSPKTKQEIQLELHVTREVKRLTEKLERVKQREDAVLGEKQGLVEDLKLLERRIEDLRKEGFNRSSEEQSAVGSSVSEKEVMRSEKEKLLLLKCAEIEALKRRRELLERWRQLHTSFVQIMTRGVARSYLATRQTDVEHLLDTLYIHFKHVQNSSLLGIQHPRTPVEGLAKMIAKSNADLKKLEKVPPALNVEKTDPRNEVFASIWGIIMDNVALRRQVNYSAEALEEKARRRLDETVRLEDTPDQYRQSEIEGDCSLLWEKQKAGLPVKDASEKAERLLAQAKVRIAKKHADVEGSKQQWQLFTEKERNWGEVQDDESRKEKEKPKVETPPKLKHPDTKFLLGVDEDRMHAERVGRGKPLTMVDELQGEEQKNVLGIPNPVGATNRKSTPKFDWGMDQDWQIQEANMSAERDKSADLPKEAAGVEDEDEEDSIGAGWGVKPKEKVTPQIEVRSPASIEYVVEKKTEEKKAEEKKAEEEGGGEKKEHDKKEDEGEGKEEKVAVLA